MPHRSRRAGEVRKVRKVRNVREVRNVRKVREVRKVRGVPMVRGVHNVRWLSTCANPENRANPENPGEPRPVTNRIITDGSIGLCARCRHAERITSARGSTFYLCRLSTTDPRFPKYPRLPVLACDGYDPLARRAATLELPDGHDPEFG